MPADHSSLAAMLRSLDIRIWDVIAFVDGSGSKRGSSGGYGVVFRTRTGRFQILHGGISSTTSQEAELRAVFELINTLLAAKLNETERGLTVHAVTDSSYVAKRLAAIDPLRILDTRTHTVWLAGIVEATRRGVRIIPHYVPRNSNPLMTLADELSKWGRLTNSNEETSQRLAETISQCDDDEQFPLTIPTGEGRMARLRRTPGRIIPPRKK